MLVRIKLYPILFIILISVSCVERFNPTFNDYDNLLVVDGYFTDEEKIHTIKLSYASSIYSREFLPVEGVQVSIESDVGEVFYFQEMSPGEYHSKDFIKGEHGKSYKLKVSIGDVKIYETEFQKMIISPDVDSVFTEREIRNTREIGEEIDGLQFYVNAKKRNEDNNYFQWELTETFEYDAEYLLEKYYAGGIFDFFDKDSLFTCWKTTQLTSIYVHSIKHLEDKTIKKFPLHYVGNDSKCLSKRYSLLIKQYALSEQAYTYWNALKEQIDNQGTLYSTQPYQIRGNLRNIDNPDEVVLGFFTVAGISEKRIFVDKPEGMEIPKVTCSVNTETMDVLPKAPAEMWPFFIISNRNGELGVVDEFCVNCMIAGGDIVKPDFWE